MNVAPGAAQLVVSQLERSRMNDGPGQRCSDVLAGERAAHQCRRAGDSLGPGRRRRRRLLVAEHEGQGVVNRAFDEKAEGVGFDQHDCIGAGPIPFGCALVVVFVQCFVDWILAMGVAEGHRLPVAPHPVDLCLQPDRVGISAGPRQPGHQHGAGEVLGDAPLDRRVVADEGRLDVVVGSPLDGHVLVAGWCRRFGRCRGVRWCGVRWCCRFGRWCRRFGRWCGVRWCGVRSGVSSDLSVVWFPMVSLGQLVTSSRWLTAPRWSWLQCPGRSSALQRSPPVASRPQATRARRRARRRRRDQRA